MECRIIAVANHKGGVGKTTTVSCLGSILAMKGHRVLLMDLDPQANLTYSLAGDVEVPGIYEAMTGRASELPVISIDPRLDLVPASESLHLIDIELSTAIGRERILSRLIRQQDFPSIYDYILFDCPPSLGLMTLNAFTVCTDVIIPLIPEVLPFKGLTMINKLIADVHSLLNPAAHITGILITRWESSKLSRGIEGNLRDKLGDTVFRTKIRKNIRLAEAPLENVNIVKYAPDSNGARDYQSFAEELLETIKNR